MFLSKRLTATVNFITKCKCLADIGTDHAYIPIYAVINNLCDSAIASDIKKGPIMVAERSIKGYGLSGKINTRIGPGLETLKSGEADAIVIAGMGGHMISDIIDTDYEKASSANFLILQPIQHQEVVRKYLSGADFKIIDEDLVLEDGKYYHVIKCSKGTPDKYDKDILYFIGKKLLEKGHPLLEEYIEFNLKLLKDIKEKLSPETQEGRYMEIMGLINDFEDVKKCL